MIIEKNKNSVKDKMELESHFNMKSRNAFGYDSLLSKTIN